MEAEAQRPGMDFSRAVPAATGALALASIVSLAICAWVVLKHKPVVLSMAPAAVALASAGALRLRPAARLMAAALAIGAGAGMYASEAIAMGLATAEPSGNDLVRDAAQADGVPYDSRPKIDIIMELRRRNVAAYPPYYPHRTFEAPLEADGAPAIPIAAVPNSVTVCCNEGGQYLIYRNDEHGFPNPPGLWEQAPMDVALVGASVAVGEAVPEADSIAYQLRQRYPKTISLGAGGNGPLLELASMREYLPVLRPRRVLWLYSESHTAEYLQKEHKVPLLRYLDPSYEQKLLAREASLSSAVRRHLDDAIDAELHPQQPTLRSEALDLLSLKRVRLQVSDLRARGASKERGRLAGDLYEQVLRRGEEIVSAWGGRITLVYVPDRGRYIGAPGYTPEVRQLYDENRATLLAVAGKLGIPVIDVSRRFEDLPPARRAEYAKYFYQFPSHFKPAGYRIMDRAILEELR